MAKQLYECSQRRERRVPCDLLIINDVSTLATAQVMALLEEASDRGAVVLAFRKANPGRRARQALELMQHDATYADYAAATEETRRDRSTLRPSRR